MCYKQHVVLQYAGGTATRTTCSAEEASRTSSGRATGASGRPVSASEARRTSATRDTGHLFPDTNASHSAAHKARKPLNRDTMQCTSRCRRGSQEPGSRAAGQCTREPTHCTTQTATGCVPGGWQRQLRAMLVHSNGVAPASRDAHVGKLALQQLRHLPLAGARLRAQASLQLRHCCWKQRTWFGTVYKLSSCCCWRGGAL